MSVFYRLLAEVIVKGATAKNVSGPEKLQLKSGDKEVVFSCEKKGI